MRRRDFVTMVGASCLGLAHRATGAEPPRPRTIYQDQGEATSLALSADDRVLAVALVSEIGLWDVRGPRHVRWIATHSPSVRQFGKDACAVRHMAFSPDGTRLATTGGMNNATRGIRIWNTDDGRLHRHIVEPWQMRIIGSEFASPLRFGPLAYSSDGSRIAAGLANGAVYVWNADDGSLVRRYGGNDAEAASVPLAEWVAGMDGVSAEEYVRTLRGTDDGGNATAVSERVTVFELPEPRLVRKVAFCAMDGLVVAALSDRVAAWDAESAAERFSWPLGTTFAVPRQGNGLAVLLKSGETEVVDCETEARRVLPPGSGLPRCYELAYVGGENLLCCIGRRLKGGLIHRTLDVNSGAIEDRPLPWLRVGEVAISSDGSEVAVTMFDGAAIARIGDAP